MSNDNKGKRTKITRKSKKIVQLKSCNYCNHRRFEYIHGGEWFGQTLKEMIGIDIIEGVAKKNFGKIVKGAQSFFSPFKSIYNVVFLKINENPLLRCKYCRLLVIYCPKCWKDVNLKDRPHISDLIECPNCLYKFQACERDDFFDRLLRIK